MALSLVKGQVLTPGQRAQLTRSAVARYSKGKTIEEIATEFNVSLGRIRKILTDAKIEIRPRGARPSAKVCDKCGRRLPRVKPEPEPTPEPVKSTRRKSPTKPPAKRAGKSATKPPTKRAAKAVAKPAESVAEPATDLGAE